MTNIVDISFLSLALGYSLLIFPLGIIIWYGVPILSQTIISIVRMTIQLLFVGLYLQVVFKLNNFWLNGIWLLVMVSVADVSIIQGCGLRLRRFMDTLFISLFVGTALPMIFFLGPILYRPHLLDAQYAIPIGGMILGNCLRANIIGIKNFYQTIRRSEHLYLQTLAQGARLSEAVKPFIRDSCQAALAPTIATMATIGLVALPGMMTGVILGGANPMIAIKYQIAIMISIFSGTSITVILAIWLTMKRSFTPYGLLDPRIFKHNNMPH